MSYKTLLVSFLIALAISMTKGVHAQESFCFMELNAENFFDPIDDKDVLYFACNCTDNQSYVKFGKGKCSQNDTRIVLPMNVEKGCVQLPQNRVKLPIEAHYSTKHILTV